MDDADTTTEILSRLSKAAIHEAPLAPLCAGAVMAAIRRSRKKTVSVIAHPPWKMLIVLGLSAAAAAFFIMNAATGAWEELHDPFYDLASYVEMIQ